MKRLVIVPIIIFLFVAFFNTRSTTVPQQNALRNNADDAGMTTSPQIRPSPKVPTLFEDTTFPTAKVVSIEKYTTLDTGLRSTPYMYWGNKKSVYHYNCHGTGCDQKDLVCETPAGFLDNVSTEFSELLKSAKKLVSYSEPQVDMYGSGFTINLSNGKSVFIGRTSVDYPALCIIGETCSYIGKNGVIPVTGIVYEKKENLIFFDEGNLFNMLNAAWENDTKGLTNCVQLSPDMIGERPSYKH